jgi:hypothetical protein
MRNTQKNKNKLGQEMKSSSPQAARKKNIEESEKQVYKVLYLNGNALFQQKQQEEAMLAPLSPVMSRYVGASFTQKKSQV